MTAEDYLKKKFALMQESADRCDFKRIDDSKNAFLYRGVAGDLLDNITTGIAILSGIDYRMLSIQPNVKGSPSWYETSAWLKALLFKRHLLFHTENSREIYMDVWGGDNFVTDRYFSGKFPYARGGLF